MKAHVGIWQDGDWWFVLVETAFGGCSDSLVLLGRPAAPGGVGHGYQRRTSAMKAAQRIGKALKLPVVVLE